MEFVNPALLAGMAAAVAPLVLHLVMRQQPRQLEFPALRLVKARQDANRRRLRVRHWLLLLLRMAALCLLALALARPSINASGLGADREAPVAAALVFDASPRMLYRQDNQTRLERARDIGLWLLSQLPRDSQAAVLESSLGSAVFQVDLGAAGQRIERLETTNVGRPLPQALAEAARLLGESPLPRKELYLFTDLTQASWDDAGREAALTKLKALSSLGVYVIDVGAAAPRNFSLGAPALSAQILPRSQPLRVASEVRGPAGQTGSRTVQLWLETGAGPAQKRSEESVELAAAGAAAVEFPPLTLEPGTHQGQIRLVGEDNLPIDDVRHFTVQVSPAWRVLLAAPDPVDAYAFILQEALAPADFRKTGRARFEIQTASLAQLAERPLEEFAAICLLDPTPLSAAAWHRLSNYVQGGGGLAVFLGPNAQPLSAFNDAAPQELLAGPLLQQARSATGELHLAPRGYQHPLLAKFAPLESKLAWDTLPVSRYWQLESVADGAVVIVPYRDGAPALIERQVGRGRALTMTTPLTALSGREPWNRLLLEFDAWPALMLANELVLYLAGASDSTLNYDVGQTATLRPRTASPLVNFVLVTPQGDTLRKNVDPAVGAVVIGSTETPGNYRVRAGGEQAGLDAGFSVNLPAAATDLTRLTEAQLQAAFGDLPIRLARTREEIDRDVTVGRVGRELYPLIIAVVVLLAALEHALANRFYRQPAEAAQAGG